MARFGHERTFDREDQLFKILEYGEGAVFYDYKFLPKEAPDFVIEQCRRFNVPTPPQFLPLALLGPALACSLVDYYDPYVLFWEFSDVMLTDEWHKFTYEITDFKGNITEADPTQLETYRFIPGQCEKTFNEWLSKPGLDSLPAYITPYMQDALNDYYAGDHYPPGLYHVKDFPSPYEVSDRINFACTDQVTGAVNSKWVDAYHDIALWAGVLWIFGPPSREFKKDHSEIFEVCFDYGECLLYDGVVLNPKYYRKIPRAPRSCYRCGIDAWCVEDTLDPSGVPRTICEGCLSVGAPRIEGCTCGSRFCKYFECPHNEYHAKGAAGLRDMMRNHGQLAQKAETGRLLLDGELPKRLLING